MLADPSVVRRTDRPPKLHQQQQDPDAPSGVVDLPARLSASWELAGRVLAQEPAGHPTVNPHRPGHAVRPWPDAGRLPDRQAVRVERLPPKGLGPFDTPESHRLALWIATATETAEIAKAIMMAAKIGWNGAIMFVSRSSFGFSESGNGLSTSRQHIGQTAPTEF